MSRLRRPFKGKKNSGPSGLLPVLPKSGVYVQFSGFLILLYNRLALWVIFWKSYNKCCKIGENFVFSFLTIFGQNWSRISKFQYKWPLKLPIWSYKISITCLWAIKLHKKLNLQNLTGFRSLCAKIWKSWTIFGEKMAKYEKSWFSPILLNS